jgi:hypothetical protein
MNCAYHNDHAVEGVCSSCGRPICGECLVDLTGMAHCKPCLETRMRKPTREVSGFARFVLSVVPGLGHLYMGLVNRGLQFMAGAVLIPFLIATLMPRGPFFAFFIAGAIFFSIFDAREAHLRMEQGLAVEDKGLIDPQTFKLEWNAKYVGYALIGIGFLVLYNTFLSDFLRLFFRNMSYYHAVVGTIRGMTLGLVAVVAGLYMLRGGFGKSS